MLSRVYDWLYKIIRGFRVPIHWVFGTHPELAELVESRRITPGRAIDLGCGVGREAIYLAEKGFEVTGVDISPTAIAMAKHAAENRGVDVRFLVDDLTVLATVDGTFDLMVDYGTLNDLNQAQRDAYMTRVLPLAADDSRFVLMCFDSKLPNSEVQERFGATFTISRISSKGETGTRRTISTYLMNKR